MTTLISGVDNRNPKKSLPLSRSKAKPVFDDDYDEDEGANGERAHPATVAGKTAFGLQGGKKNTARPPPSSLLNQSPSSSSTLTNDAPIKKPSLFASKAPPTTNLSALHTQRQQAAEAEAVDPSIYDYDGAFDAIHAHDAARKKAATADASQRRPRYIDKALAAAEVRKRDQLRAKDKMLQREREAEGEDFADKAKYVTGGYKKQQEEVRQLEEEERRKEEREKERRKKLGLDADGDGTGRFLYKSLMEEEDKKVRDRERAAELAAAAVNDSSPAKKENENDDRAKEKSDADIARDLNAKGANIVINEEGEVAIKTQLLSAGLNVAPKPKPNDSSDAIVGTSRSSKPFATSLTNTSSASGRSSTHKAVRERQTRLVEEQLAQAAKRAVEEETEEQTKLVRATKSKKTEGEISGARERYLRRKAEAEAEKKKS